MPFLDKHAISYYNPQVDDWYPELVQQEAKAKEAASVLLFVFSSQTRAVSSMVEVAVNAASRAASLVVVLEPVAKGAVIAGTPIDDNQWLDLTKARAALRRVLTREGVPVFSSLDQALPHVARMAKHNRPEQCQRQQQRQAERMPGATALPFLHQHETHIRANARGMTALIEAAYILSKSPRQQPPFCRHAVVVEDVPAGAVLGGCVVDEAQRKDLNRGRAYLRDAARELGMQHCVWSSWSQYAAC